MANSVLTQTTSDLENGVSVVAAKDGNDVVRIMIVNHKYRLDRTTPIEITLPASVPSDSPITYYLIDADHSNYWDAGSGDGSLGTVSSPTIVAGTVTLEMQPRSVHLLVFAEPTGAPVVTVLPFITGDAIDGATLSCDSGTWTNTPTSYAYQWQSSPNGTTWTDTQTGSTLVLSGYNDLFVRCGVTATNGDGASSPAYSLTAGPVATAVVGRGTIYGITVVDGIPYLVRCDPN